MMRKREWQKIVKKFDEACSRGLCHGVGDRDGQMCVEAAICYAMGLPHGDAPTCVEPAVRKYKIAINDKCWTSPQARAEGLRDIGIAQIGSKGAVNGTKFTHRLTIKTINRLIPAILREVFPDNNKILSHAKNCAKARSLLTALKASRATAATLSTAYADAAYAAYTDAVNTAYTAYASAAYAAYASAADAAAAAAAADDAAADAAADVASYKRDDKYLLMSVGLALEVLKELKSPGCAYV